MDEHPDLLVGGNHIAQFIANKEEVDLETLGENISAGYAQRIRQGLWAGQLEVSYLFSFMMRKASGKLMMTMDLASLGKAWQAVISLHHSNTNNFIQLTLISQLFDVAIVTYRHCAADVLIPTGQIIPTDSPNTDNMPTIHLIYDGRHYDTLVPVDNAIAGDFIIVPTISDINGQLQDVGKLYLLCCNTRTCVFLRLVLLL